MVDSSWKLGAPHRRPTDSATTPRTSCIGTCTSRESPSARPSKAEPNTPDGYPSQPADGSSTCPAHQLLGVYTMRPVSPTRHSRTARCKCHARRPYPPFWCELKYPRHYRTGAQRLDVALATALRTGWVHQSGAVRVPGQMFRYAGPGPTYSAHSVWVRDPPISEHTCASASTR